ncbi:hypothetical protein CA948_02045 [Alcaligenes aquatilis]|nr:hypothetical protein CA948_02045 [Alcaligenes aquatilis]
MKKRKYKAKKQNTGNAKNRNPQIDQQRAEHLETYNPKTLTPQIDFDLERKAVQEILDAVVRLQTYLSLRERCG